VSDCLISTNKKSCCKVYCVVTVMPSLIRFSSLLSHGRAVHISRRTLIKLKDEDFSMEFLEGDHKGIGLA